MYFSSFGFFDFFSVFPRGQTNVFMTYSIFFFFPHNFVIDSLFSKFAITTSKHCIETKLEFCLKKQRKNPDKKQQKKQKNNKGAFLVLFL